MHCDLKKLFDFVSSISILLSIFVDKNFSITIEYFRWGPILIRHTFVTYYKLSGFVVPDLVIVHPPFFSIFLFWFSKSLYHISILFLFFSNAYYSMVDIVLGRSTKNDLNLCEHMAFTEVNLDIIVNSCIKWGYQSLQLKSLKNWISKDHFIVSFQHDLL